MGSQCSMSVRDSDFGVFKIMRFFGTEAPPLQTVVSVSCSYGTLHAFGWYIANDENYHYVQLIWVNDLADSVYCFDDRDN